MREASLQILIVEDDPKIAQILEKAFTDNDYAVTLAADGEKGLALASQGEFDLLISDVMLPLRDGFSLVEALRAKGNETPVLFLSAKHSAEDRIEGLQRGGDDYIVKPFSLPEVLVRARTILRRANRTVDTAPLKYEDLEIDLLSRKAFRSGHTIELHPKEFALLECLLRHRGKVLSKTQILDKVWKYDFDPQTNVVDVLVCRLRNKVDRDFERKLIKTIRGVGYVLQSE